MLFRGTTALTATGNAGLELYYSADDGGAGTGQAFSPPPSGTPIWESFGDPTQDDKFQSLSQLVPSGPLSSLGLAYMWDLRYLIPAGEWFIKASILSSDAATVVDWGLALTLFEQVDPELIVDLLG